MLLTLVGASVVGILAAVGVIPASSDPSPPPVPPAAPPPEQPAGWRDGIFVLAYDMRIVHSECVSQCAANGAALAALRNEEAHDAAVAALVSNAYYQALLYYGYDGDSYPGPGGIETAWLGSGPYLDAATPWAWTESWGSASIPLDNSGVDGFGGWQPDQPFPANGAGLGCYTSAAGCCAALQLNGFRASTTDHSVATTVEGAWAAIPCDTDHVPFCVCMGTAPTPLTAEEAKAMITQAQPSGALR